MPRAPLSTRLCGGQLCGLRPECLPPGHWQGNLATGCSPASVPRCPVQVEHKRNAALSGLYEDENEGGSAEDPAWRPLIDL